MQNLALQLQDLVVGYPGRVLTSPLSLQLPVGSRLGIIGGNGSGKTTLLKTLMGIQSPLQGSYQWKPGSQFGYVPQESHVDPLFPLSVSDLLKMGMLKGLSRFRKTSPSYRKAALSMLEEMEIPEREEALVRDLSGGERQRALIARAWINKPQVLVMDEPFAAIDHRFKEKLWGIFSSWQRDHELTLLIIDHDLNRVINQVDWLIVLGHRGTAVGPVEEILKPETLSHAYGAPLHVHRENGQFQVHFL